MKYQLLISLVFIVFKLVAQSNCTGLLNNEYGWVSEAPAALLVAQSNCNGAQTRETANADQRCGSVKATRRCAASTFVRA